MKIINFTKCQLRFVEGGKITTVFDDSKHWSAWPHENPHYHVIAHRCGYGDDLWRYCLEHEFAHLFLSENQLLPSLRNVIRLLACGEKPFARQAAIEEVMVQTFQRWLRANERPIIGGVDWDGLKRGALRMLA